MFQDYVDISPPSQNIRQFVCFDCRHSDTPHKNSPLFTIWPTRQIDWLEICQIEYLSTCLPLPPSCNKKAYPLPEEKIWTPLLQMKNLPPSCSHNPCPCVLASQLECDNFASWCTVLLCLPFNHLYKASMQLPLSIKMLAIDILIFFMLSLSSGLIHSVHYE